MKSIFIGTICFILGFVIAGYRSSERNKCPEMDKAKPCEQMTFNQMMSIVTRYGVFVDQMTYGSSEEKKAASDSVKVYQGLYKIGQ